MFHELLLTKEGFIKVIKHEKKKEVVLDLNPDKVLRALNDNQISLDDKFTLRSYFKLFKNYPILSTLEDWVDEYLEEVDTCPQIGCVSKEMPNAYIQIKQIVELDTVKARRDYIDEKGEFNFNTKKLIEVNEKLFSTHFNVSMIDPDSEDDTQYAIEFTPLAELLDVPIRISDKVSVLKKATNRKGKMRLRQDTYENESGIKLYDFITQIIYEVSFLGAPEKRDAEKEELKKRIEEVEKGEVELIPFDEVKKRMSDKLNVIRNNHKDKGDDH